MKELGFLLLGFLLVGGPSLFAFVKIWERVMCLQMRFDEHQMKLRDIGTYVTDANERLWAAGMLNSDEEKLKELGLNRRSEGTRVEPNYRKWDL